jgi:hypothetical protein
MVLAECAVVAALAMVAWHMVASPPVRAASAPPSASTPSASTDDGGQVSPDLASPSARQASPAPPGLNVDATFWRLRLAELNGGEAEFEALEWRIVHSAMAAARRYIQTVVMPAITRAESGE